MMSHRFKLVLCVMDAYGGAKCMLFENDAKLILQQSSMDVLEGVFEDVSEF